MIHFGLLQFRFFLSARHELAQCEARLKRSETAAIRNES